MEIITPGDMPNDIMARLFFLEYGEQTTLQQMREDAAKHLWIRFYLQERGVGNGEL